MNIEPQVTATLLAGLLTAVATFVAVILTNKQNAERYEKDKKRQAMVIIKPSMKWCTFFKIIEELILFNNRDRVLLVSSEKDGFDFYDDNDRLHGEAHRIFSIKNESKSNINSVNIRVYSKITTGSDAAIEDQNSNFIKLLRDNEEIIFRICNTEQRNKLWEQLNENKQVELTFGCEINYLTSAEEQVCYEYEAKIINSPEKKIFDEEERVINNEKISVIKDEYSTLGKITLDKNVQASVFRNLQDFISLDRIKYIHNKVGAAQAQGMWSELGNILFGMFSNVANAPRIEGETQDKDTK